MVGDKEMRAALHNVPFTVTKENGDWAWIGTAWIKKDQLVPLEQAAPFYSDHIHRNPNSTSGVTTCRGRSGKTRANSTKRFGIFR